jgi:hypothetical protein
MSRPRQLILACVLFTSSVSAWGDPPRAPNRRDVDLPVGQWSVTFANGVGEVCHIGNGGETVVDEPGRGARGAAMVQGGSVVITYNDDRVERWTPVAQRFVVEHWFPGSRLPTVTPVLGIADRTQ